MKTPLFTLLLVLAGGCASVYPPKQMTDPVPIYLASYNVHSSVLLPARGVFFEYTFGDWNYSALNHKFINDMFGALAVSNMSAFELRIIPPDPSTGWPVFPDHPDNVTRLYASQVAIDQRLRDLDQRMQSDVKQAGKDGYVWRPATSEYFARDPAHYGLDNNCNHLTAETLRALGYRVDGVVIANSFRLVDPDAPGEEIPVKATLKTR